MENRCINCAWSGRQIWTGSPYSHAIECELSGAISTSSCSNFRERPKRCIDCVFNGQYTICIKKEVCERYKEKSVTCKDCKYWEWRFHSDDLGDKAWGNCLLLGCGDPEKRLYRRDYACDGFEPKSMIKVKGKEFSEDTIWEALKAYIDEI